MFKVVEKQMKKLQNLGMMDDDLFYMEDIKQGHKTSR
jgi:hypothetical protein